MEPSYSKKNDSAAGQARKQEESAENLLNALRYFHPISKGAADFLRTHTYPIRLAKKKLLLRAGAICEHLYFIRSGVLRGFVKNGKQEITTWITAENELVTSIAGLNGELPSRENIQAIEDCELLAMSFTDLERLYDLHPDFNIPVRKILQKYYHDAEQRAFISRISKADLRYEYFLETQPHLANRIALTYIASYLSMAQETLSKIRKKRSLKKEEKVEIE